MGRRIDVGHRRQGPETTLIENLGRGGTVSFQVVFVGFAI
jgi:hypothetical protein